MWRIRVWDPFILIESYSAWIGFIIVAFLIVFGIWHLYGNFIPHLYRNANQQQFTWGRFERDVAMMVGPSHSKFSKFMKWYLRVSLWFITPFLLLFIVIYQATEYSKPTLHLKHTTHPHLSKGQEGFQYVYGIGGVIFSQILNFTPQVLMPES